MNFLVAVIDTTSPKFVMYNTSPGPISAVRFGNAANVPELNVTVLVSDLLRNSTNFAFANVNVPLPPIAFSGKACKSIGVIASSPGTVTTSFQ